VPRSVGALLERTQDMARLIVSEWMSLDGVFDASSMEQWFQPYDSPDRGEYIKANVDSSDAVLVGKTTYEMLAAYWPSKIDDEAGIADRLNAMPKFVVSKTLRSPTWNNTGIIENNVVERISELKRQPGQDLIIFGSATLVESLMKTDLIDELRFLVHPIIAAGGKHFFREGMAATRLKLLKTKIFTHGVQLFCYQPAFR
jgi:dihydrofolate reductase